MKNDRVGHWEGDFLLCTFFFFVLTMFFVV